MEHAGKGCRACLIRETDAKCNPRPAGGMLELHGLNLVFVEPAFQFGARGVEIGSDMADFDNVKHVGMTPGISEEILSSPEVGRFELDQFRLLPSPAVGQARLTQIKVNMSAAP
jgi:hypothetical protein